MGKESSFVFTFKCIGIPQHKSFPTWGRILSFLPPWLTLTTWGRSQAFFLWYAKLFFPTLRRSHTFFLKVHPSPSCSQKMQCYPSPQILSHLYVGKDSSRGFFLSLQNAKPPQILLYIFFCIFKPFFHFIFICLNIFVCFFFFFTFCFYLFTPIY